MGQTKICTKCEEDLPETKEFFYFRKDSKSFKNKCIKCCKKEFKKYHKENIAKIKNRRKIHYNIPEVRERILEEKKEYRKILENKARAKEYQKKYTTKPENKEKRKKYLDKPENKAKAKKKRDNTKEQRAKYAKEYRNRPGVKEKRTKSDKEYRNRLENKIRRNKNRKDRSRKSDINFKLTEKLRGRILDALQKNWKSASTLELLGCTVKEARRHLEKQFLEGMTWDNHGLYGWHIDHVRPCASFDLSKPEEQLICFNYGNLQPLWAEDNLKKSDRWI